MNIPATPYHADTCFRSVGLVPAWGALLLALAWASGVSAGEPDVADFFEKEVRPLLVEQCQMCHGANKVRGGLRLDGRESLLRGGDSGPAAVPGKPEESLLVEAIEHKGELKMPPKGKLAEAEIARLKRWIALGLPWPDAGTAARSAKGGASRGGEDRQSLWAFQPIKGVLPPPVKDGSWAHSEIDQFILAALEARGIAPAHPAEKRTLLRRATFDLTGLPPTPQEVEAFLADDAPQAFARVVDRLLASPAYGERWGRHWLDVVRYTDYHYPEPKAHPRSSLFELFEAWRYRDWVVEAMNRDMPYDQFIVHQVAGDRLPGPQGESLYPEGLVATGLLAIGVWDNGDADKKKIVTDIVDDQIDVVGKAFLGLTLACARCHDHKFDPISQNDYYGLAGIFHSTHILANVGGIGDHTVALRVPLVPPSYLALRDRQQRLILGLKGVEKALESPAPRTSRARSWVARARVIASAALPCPLVARALRPDAFRAAGAVKWVRRRRESLERQCLPEPPVALAAQEGGTPGGMFTGIQDVPVHVRGSYTRLGQLVPRHVPAALAGQHQTPITGESGRLGLARWIARAENPLTARVMVNRVWQHHFGAGIVRTPSNFGKLGEPPTHPELLDWLADRFVRDGWSIKSLHRRIMLSATYQQSGEAKPEDLKRDPENRWLGRMRARRLEAEAIRDSMLAVAGRLEPTIGGPANAELGRPRRSLYVQTTRQDRSNYSTLFDAANPEAASEARTTSTVAPQALFLLNGRMVREQAGRLARRLLEEVPGDDGTRIDRAHCWLYGRPARAAEVEIGLSFLASERSRGTEAAWADYAHILLCANEFVYID